MKKKIFALVLVLAMLLSCMLMLTSCPEETPDDGPTGSGEPNVDEGLNGAGGSSSVFSSALNAPWESMCTSSMI